jgi:hypothetical protein
LILHLLLLSNHFISGNPGAIHSVSFGYEYIMAVPEPETYAMLITGLGLIGFSARRRRVM